MTYVMIFLTGMITGAAALICYALCEANKGRIGEEKQGSQGDACNNCFGAAEGDCESCKWHGTGGPTRMICELCDDGELWERGDSGG